MTAVVETPQGRGHEPSSAARGRSGSERAALALTLAPTLRGRAGLAAALGIAFACTPLRPPAEGSSWQSAIAVDHPLAGRIFDLGAGVEIGEPELVGALARVRFVILGESHENEDHHRLQAQVLRGLAARGAAPAVAFEMLRADQQQLLDAVLADDAPSAGAVRDATDWDEGGWPDFVLYAPVFEAALAAGSPLVAADLSREQRLQLASGDPPPAALRARFGLEEPLPEPIQRTLERDLLEAHCGMLPASALGRLVQVQRGRDAALARALLEAPGSGDAGTERGVRAVLIAGAEHARKDRGAPRALARLAPGSDVASLAFLEVDVDQRDPWADLGARYGSEPVFDYVWYTPKASRELPCDRWRRDERR